MSVVLVVTSAPPLVAGGHMVIARALERALVEAGHQASVVTTPSNRFGRQGSAYVANWFTDVGKTGDGLDVDHVISLRYPSYAVRHPRHVCWLNHTMREVTDLWDEFSSGLSAKGRLKERVRRRLIRTADTYLLRRNVTRVVAQSATVRARLREWNGIDSEVLHPPPPPRPYRCDSYDDYLLVVSRLSPLKRIDLILQALADPAARQVHCVIVGDGEERQALEQLAHTLGIAPRVRFVGHVSDDDLVGHLARCRGVVFVPKREDYGFVTVEAFASGKPIITAHDSGGPTELVVSGRNGLVVEPVPGSLAIAMSAIFDSPADAERLGQQGRRDTAHLTWSATVAALLSPQSRR